MILEIDKRGGMFTESTDQVAKFTVDYASADTFDWAGNLNHYIGQLTQRRGLFR